MNRDIRDTQENKLLPYAHLRRFGILKSCDVCGAIILLKCQELTQVENPMSLMYCRRVPLKRWWIAHNADKPDRKHRCRDHHDLDKTGHTGKGVGA